MKIPLTGSEPLEGQYIAKGWKVNNLSAYQGKNQLRLTSRQRCAKQLARLVARIEPYRFRVI
jgi:hypothetical protein